MAKVLRLGIKNKRVYFVLFLTFRTFAALIDFYIMSISKHLSINKRQAIAVLKLYLTYFLVSEIWIFIIDGFTFGRDFLLMPLFVFFIYSPINTLFVVLIHKLNICKCIIYSNSARFIECIINIWVLTSCGMNRDVWFSEIEGLHFNDNFDNNLLFTLVFTLIFTLIYDFVGRKFKFIREIKARYILLILVIILSLSTLPRTTYFDDDDLSWVNHYAVGDTIKFVSENNDIDTLIINDVKIYNSWFNASLFREKGKAFIATAFIKYTISHNKELLDGELTIVKDEKDKPIKVMWNIAYNYLDNNYDEGNRLKKYRIGKEVFDDCLIRDCIISNAPIHDGFVVWSKSKGLLQYQFGDGLIYTRIGN